MFSSVLPVAMPTSRNGRIGPGKQNHTQIPKGFSVRVFTGPTLSSFPYTATAKFDVGPMSAVNLDARQRQHWYSSQNPKTSVVPPQPSQSRASSTTYDINGSGRPGGLSSYSIYPSASNGTYIYERSVSSKSDIYSNSESDASVTTLSPTSLLSPALSTDSTLTLKSPFPVERGLDGVGITRPASAAFADRQSFPIQMPTLAPTQGRGIQLNHTPEADVPLHTTSPFIPSAPSGRVTALPPSSTSSDQGDFATVSGTQSQSATTQGRDTYPASTGETRERSQGPANGGNSNERSPSNTSPRQRSSNDPTFSASSYFRRRNSPDSTAGYMPSNPSERNIPSIYAPPSSRVESDNWGLRNIYSNGNTRSPAEQESFRVSRIRKDSIGVRGQFGVSDAGQPMTAKFEYQSATSVPRAGSSHQNTFDPPNGYNPSLLHEQEAVRDDASVSSSASSEQTLLSVNDPDSAGYDPHQPTHTSNVPFNNGINPSWRSESRQGNPAVPPPPPITGSYYDPIALPSQSDDATRRDDYATLGDHLYRTRRDSQSRPMSRNTSERPSFAQSRRGSGEWQGPRSGLLPNGFVEGQEYPRVSQNSTSRTQSAPIIPPQVAPNNETYPSNYNQTIMTEMANSTRPNPEYPGVYPSFPSSTVDIGYANGIGGPPRSVSDGSSSSANSQIEHPGLYSGSGRIQGNSYAAPRTSSPTAYDPSGGHAAPPIDQGRSTSRQLPQTPVYTSELRRSPDGYGTQNFNAQPPPSATPRTVQQPFNPPSQLANPGPLQNLTNSQDLPSSRTSPPEPHRRSSDSNLMTHRHLAEPQRRHSDGDQTAEAMRRPAANVPTVAARCVRWHETLICPSPIFAHQRKKGWFNRRGDQLWTNEGSYKPPAAGEEYPVEFDGYPEYGQGWMNEEGVRIDMRHRLIPKPPLRSALKRRSQLGETDKE